MFKSLLLLSALLGINSMPVAHNCDDQYYGVQQKQYQHTEDVGNTEVTYKYESNEVNSLADLVVGNIYQLDLSLIPLENGNITDCKMVSVNKANTNIFYYSAEDTSFIRIQHSSTGDVGVWLNDGTNWSSNYTFSNQVTLVFVYYANFKDTYINAVSYTDYNEIVSVTYIPPTTIFGHLAEVLGDNLYGGIPNVDNVIFNIGGQDVTLKSWLVTSTCIVLAVVLITILCLFIRWLFKLFSNTILLR